MKKYVVVLTQEQREYLHRLVSSGRAPARAIRRAHILLKSACSKPPEREEYFFEPLAGWRHIKVTQHRTCKDWAVAMKELSLRYPDAEKIVVVMDNLNTHTPASFYKVFEPQEAFELAQRFEFHYTPKHGSWLNMAEIELSVLARECLNHRIGEVDTLTKYVSLWQEERNSEVVKVDWRFTTQDARIKLKRLYPIFKNTIDRAIGAYLT